MDISMYIVQGGKKLREHRFLARLERKDGNSEKL